MREITLEQLLEAGCHFGHQVTRSNPKARDFIFEARDGIHIIDLAKTKEGLEDAGKFLKTLAQKPDATLLIVGTKRQTHEVLEKEIARVSSEINGEAGLYYVTNKWIGGILTNFGEVSKNFKKLIDLTHKLETPSEQQGYTKKEIGGWAKSKEKLTGFYGGVYSMKRVPDALFIIDSHLEDLAVKESFSMKVPSVAIVDTNADPALVTYAIPANDDAVGSLELIIGYIMDSWKEGRNSVKIPSSSPVDAKALAGKEKPAEAKKDVTVNQEVGIKNQEKTDEDKLKTKKPVKKEKIKKEVKKETKKKS